MASYRANDPIEVIAVLQPLAEYARCVQNVRSPIVGDRGTILQVQGPADNPRYFVSCTEPGSSLIWSANLVAAEFRLLQTQYSMAALAFANAVAAGLFEAAHFMLTPVLRQDYSAARLQLDFETNFADAGPDASDFDIQASGLRDEWPGKLPTEIGAAYVSISRRSSNGDIWNEAIDVVVSRSKTGLLISRMEWGRL